MKDASPGQRNILRRIALAAYLQVPDNDRRPLRTAS